jgi:hypothetical protein
MSVRVSPRIVEAKTADYTLTTSDFGKIFTNRGASGSVTFTLPASSSATPQGATVEVYCVEAQTVIVASATVDTMVVFNDKAADSISWATSGQIIGNSAVFTYDGTGWLVGLRPATTGAAQTASTVTIAT